MKTHTNISLKALYETYGSRLAYGYEIKCSEETEEYSESYELYNPITKQLLCCDDEECTVTYMAENNNYKVNSYYDEPALFYLTQSEVHTAMFGLKDGNQILNEIDCISRVDLMKTIDKYKFGGISNDVEREFIKDTVLNFIKSMPRITMDNANSKREVGC